MYEDTSAWIKSDFLDVSEEVTDIGVINDNNVNIRNDASTDGEIISTLNKGDRISILDTYNYWYKIQTGEFVGYVYKDFATMRNSEVSRGTSSNNDTRSNIAAYAKRFLGTAYVYGGNSPDYGFDCSGFTKYIMAQYGIGLERVAADQAVQGRYVSKADLRPGDLVFFDTDGGSNYINHAGIYIGGGQFIHASTTKVIITNLSDSFYINSYMTARNILD
jgi:N-acetylmuramoyl-L-alanine amidase